MSRKGSGKRGRGAASFSVSPSLQGGGCDGVKARRAPALSSASITHAPLVETERIDVRRDVPSERRRGRAAHLKTIRFTIDGPLMGYRQTTSRSIWHAAERMRSHRYGAFKSYVFWSAFAEGFVSNDGISPADPCPSLSVKVFWKGKSPRIDWPNVYKAVEDSLWYVSDRTVQPGSRSGFVCNAHAERAEVIVEYKR